MPLILPDGLPAISTLSSERVPLFLADKAAGGSALRIAVLNLMPKKVETETDIVRMLAHSPFTIELRFMRLRSHTSTHVSAEHMDRYYEYADELMAEHMDGLIVTGAPVETIDYEQVDYWPELMRILDWARCHVRSTLYLCWGAMAALYHFYGIPKHLLPTKRFGVFGTMATDGSLPIFHGFDDTFSMPNSRHTEIRQADIDRATGVKTIAYSAEAGVSIVAPAQGTDLYVLGHLEYPTMTLDGEYHRDLGKRSDVEVPQHYYPGDDPMRRPLCTWRSAATLFYTNWIRYYVAPSATIMVKEI